MCKNVTLSMLKLPVQNLPSSPSSSEKLKSSPLIVDNSHPIIYAEDDFRGVQYSRT
jgi:hypothetical protein